MWGASPHLPCRTRSNLKRYCTFTEKTLTFRRQFPQMDSVLFAGWSVIVRGTSMITFDKLITFKILKLALDVLILHFKLVTYLVHRQSALPLE